MIPPVRPSEQGHSQLDSVIFTFLPVDHSRIDALSAGAIDWADAIPLQQVSALSKDPRFTYVTSATVGIPHFLAMNTTQAPYDDQGVFAAKPDVAKAKQLLADAGYPDGLSIDYLGLSQYPELLKTGQIVREQLKAIGVDLKISAVDVSVWYDAFVSGNYQITSAYQERTIDPDNFYSLVVKSGGPINTTGYSNPEVDALIAEAATTDGDEARAGLYQQIRKIVTADAPLVFTHYETLNYLMNKNVVGSEITPTLSLHMENISLND